VRACVVWGGKGRVHSCIACPGTRKRSMTSSPLTRNLDLMFKDVFAAMCRLVAKVDNAITCYGCASFLS
jgi:hypothetical protein